jgi:hypothetical protein
MRTRSILAIATIGLLGGAAQVSAHGGGFHGGGPHMIGRPIFTHGPGSVLPIPSPAYAVARPDSDQGVRHDFRQDDGRRDMEFRRDQDRFGAPLGRIGFPGGSINFAPRPPRQVTPVLYNYYYGPSSNYYSNVVSTYGVPADACPACAR